MNRAPLSEAIRNAGKHAGAGTEILVHVDHTDGTLRFHVIDDSPAFDLDAGGAAHGFVTERHRLDAVGGTPEITSGPGGTTIAGVIPDLA